MSKETTCENELLYAYQNAIKCRSSISYKKPKEKYATQYEEAKVKVERLKDLNEEIIGNILLNWAQVSDNNIVKLNELNDSLKDSVKKIKGDIETAKSVTEALGTIDEILLLAASIAGGPLG